MYIVSSSLMDLLDGLGKSEIMEVKPMPSTFIMRIKTVLGGAIQPLRQAWVRTEARIVGRRVVKDALKLALKSAAPVNVSKAWGCTEFVRRLGMPSDRRVAHDIVHVVIERVLAEEQGQKAV